MLSTYNVSPESEKVGYMGKRHKRKHERQSLRKLKAAVLDVLTDPTMLADIRGECEIYGLTVRVAYVDCRGHEAPRHWMFEREDDGQRVLDWWPTTGKTWSPVTLERRVINDVWELVRYAGQCKEKSR